MKILKSGNIRLLPLAAEHEPDFVRLANLPEINQRVNKPLIYSGNHFAEQLANLQKAKASFCWMIEQEGKLVGVVNNAALRDARLFQGGYWIDPSCWGKGAATASLALVRDFILNECGAMRIQAVVEPDNPASIRVLEKCGYVREGLLKKFCPHTTRGPIDVFMYAIVK